MSKSETRWVIVGKDGLYPCHWKTRNLAQWKHAIAVYDLRREHMGKATLRRYWQKCRADGDRAVKATITWDTATRKDKEVEMQPPS